MFEQWLKQNTINKAKLMLRGFETSFVVCCRLICSSFPEYTFSNPHNEQALQTIKAPAHFVY